MAAPAIAVSDVSKVITASTNDNLPALNPYAYLTNPDAMRPVMSAIYGAVNSPVVITGIGDSLTQMGGETSNPSNDVQDERLGYLAALRRELNNRLGLPTMDGGQWYDPDAQVSDSRVTNAGGVGTGGSLIQWAPWKSFVNGGGSQTHRSAIQFSAAGHTLTWTVTNARFATIYFWESASTTFTATWSYTVDGGAAVNVTSTGLEDTYRSVTVDLGSQGTHTIKLDWVSGSKALIIGCLATPQYGVATCRFAVGSTRVNTSGGLTENATNSTTRNFTVTFKTVPSVLQIIRLSYNDWKNQDTTLISPELFATNVRNLISNALANASTAGVLLMSDPVTSTTDSKRYLYAQYAAALESLATGPVSFFDLNSILTSYATQSARGYFVDFVHRTGAGYAVEAKLLASALMSDQLLAI